MAQHAHQLGMAVIGELGETSYSWAIRNSEIDALVHARRYTRELAPLALQKAVGADPFGPVTDQLDNFLVENYGNRNPKLDESVNLNRYARQLGSWRGALRPTLSSMYPDLRKPNLWKESAARFLDPKDIHFPYDLETGKTTYSGVSPPTAFYTRPLIVRTVFKLENRFREAGAHYLASSRAPVWGSLPGLSLHVELSMFQEQVGMTPREAIAAATENYREVFGWRKFGKIARGAHADILVLQGDPTKNLEDLKKIKTIYQDREPIDRESLLTQCKK